MGNADGDSYHTSATGTSDGQTRRVLAKAMNSDDWKWSQNKEDGAVKKGRAECQKEINDRYK